MDSYEIKVKRDLSQWEKEMLAKTSILEKSSRNIQKKMDSLIPTKFHTAMCKALELGINSILKGINLIPLNKEKLANAQTKFLIDIDEDVNKIIKRYQRIATASGAGTGAGGFLGLTIDYPSLISLKLKMLQEIAQAFGHDIRRESERNFLLKTFLLAFSSDSSRRKTYLEIISWPRQNQLHINWQELYREYKEKVEYKKTFQIVPGLGAFVGGWANYGLLKELGETARNCYRLRYFRLGK